MRPKRLKDGQEDPPTESNLTETNHDTRLARGAVSPQKEVETDPTSEPTDKKTAHAEQRERDEFLRSHLRGSVAFEEDDEVSLDLAALKPQSGADNEGSILVGSMVLPSLRGSSRWDLRNWEPEVSDFVCEEEDVIHSDKEEVFSG